MRRRAAQQDGSDQQEQDQRRDPCRDAEGPQSTPGKWRWSVPHAGPETGVAAKMANRPPSHFPFFAEPVLDEVHGPAHEIPRRGHFTVADGKQDFGKFGRHA